MARTKVIEIVCGRCGKVEYKPDTDQSTELKRDTPLLSIEFDGEIFEFDDLCSRCLGTIRKYLESVKKDLKNSRRGKRKKVVKAQLTDKVAVTEKVAVQQKTLS